MSIAVLGEALIDLIARGDGAYQPHLGGSPYNVAIGLARQGMDVSYLSPLSDDHFGDQLHASLIKETVQLPEQPRSKWPTSLAMVKVAQSGQASYRLYREGIADKDISAENILANLPDNLKLFHTGSLAITPSQLPKIKSVFTHLHKKAVLLSIDINIRLGASIDTDAYLAGVRSLLPFVDIVKASDEDIDALEIDKDTLLSAEQIYTEMRSGLLLLTLGTGGAVLFCDEHRVEVPGYPVASIADTVGAGDTFHAAFLSSLEQASLLSKPMAQWPLEILKSAVDYACAAAAINVSRVGCNPPTIAEVESYIDSAKR